MQISWLHTNKAEYVMFSRCRLGLYEDTNFKSCCSKKPGSLFGHCTVLWNSLRLVSLQNCVYGFVWLHSDHLLTWQHPPWTMYIAMYHPPICSATAICKVFCETRWPRLPLFSPSWLIQWSMGEGSYISLFSPSDVTAFYRMKYGGVVLYNLVFTEWRHCVSKNLSHDMHASLLIFVIRQHPKSHTVANPLAIQCE